MRRWARGEQPGMPDVGSGLCSASGGLCGWSGGGDPPTLVVVGRIS